ncbi:MAG TPA: efflux RND transporter permease subunit, partial [Nitrospiraceae bacterium]|nr:efflux RND transporter permease subunit [Nitrospiraceae bacterium]
NLRYLPQGVFPPIIIKFGAASLPIAVQTTSSAAMSEKEVRDLAYFNVRPQLGGVPGIAFPTTFGGTVRQITVFLDPALMLARGISTHEIVQAVNAQSLLLPAGNVKIGDFDYNVYTNSMIKVVGQMNDIPIKVVNGVPVFLRDVGKAVDSTMVQVNVVRINGNRAVYLPILKQAGANAIQVIDGVKQVLPHLVGIPADLTVKLLFDQSLYIRQAIQTLEHEGLLGGGLACLMVLLFLGSLRSTLVIALAIPLSVTAAFIGLYFTGHSINIMTLGGLALAVGRLVDDAIVVVENFHRHIDMGKTSAQAAGDAVSEVAMPMLVITITVFLVFLPIAFFTGVIKFLFVPLALAVAYAMMASYFVALTVAPVSMARLMRGHGAHGEAHTAKQGTLSDFWNRLNLFDPFVDRYVVVLKWCLRHKAIVIVSVTVVFAGSLLMAPLLATEFFPKVDAGSFILNVSAPEGTRIEKTEAIVAKIEDLIRAHIPENELDQIVSNIGLPQGWMVLYSPVNGPHQAFILVSLTPDHQVRTDDIIAGLRGALNHELPGLKFGFQTGGIVSDVINAGLPAPIDIKVSGPKLTELAETANRIRDIVAAVPGTADVQVRQGMDYPEIHLDINRDKASYVGLDERQIVTDLITGLSSNVTLNPGYWIDPRTNNAYFVVTQFPEQLLVEFDDFLNLPLIGTHVEHPATASIGGNLLRGSSLVLAQTPFPVRPRLPGSTMNGTPIILRDLVDVTRRTGPEVVDHHNLQRTMDVLVGVPGNDLGHVAGAVERAVAALTIPKDVRVTLKGEVDSMRAALSGFAGTLPLAMVLIYLVMVGLFRSWMDPFVIMFAVPLGFIGVIWMLLATDTSVNVESLIGTLMMIGIVVSNSVLLVDFANHRLQEGMPLEEAVVEAGRLRIRPILMTSLATIIGLAPMALGLGEGSEANMPLARAVIGGLGVSTIMTLLFIPVLHAALRRRSPNVQAAETRRN